MFQREIFCRGFELANGRNTERPRPEHDNSSLASKQYKVGITETGNSNNKMNEVVRPLISFSVSKNEVIQHFQIKVLSCGPMIRLPGMSIARHSDTRFH